VRIVDPLKESVGIPPLRLKQVKIVASGLNKENIVHLASPGVNLPKINAVNSASVPGEPQIPG
jgi:hypothetical protein